MITGLISIESQPKKVVVVVVVFVVGGLVVVAIVSHRHLTLKFSQNWDNNKANIEAFQQLIHVSCFNMCNWKLFIWKFPSRKSHFIRAFSMIWHGRYKSNPDKKNKLVKFANNTLFQMWLNSPLKKNAQLGQHRINIGREDHQYIFRSQVTNQYDPHSCPQALYQKRQAMKYQTSIHTQNRFSVLNANLGNQ